MGYSPWGCKESDLTKWLILSNGDNKGFPGASVVKNPPTNAGAVGSITGLGKSPGQRGPCNLKTVGHNLAINNNNMETIEGSLTVRW